MILNHGVGVFPWTWSAGSCLLLSLSIITASVKADFPKDKHYTWKTGQWGRCVGEDCGPGGVQTRTVWCVHSDGGTTHHSHCRPDKKPESLRACFRVCEWHRVLFEWEVSEWGACALVPHASDQVSPRTVECVTAQHGIQRRGVRCVRGSNRTAVAEHICEFFSPRPALEQACLIPCPQDCVVSDFSTWSICSRTCGAGLQHRTRAVLAAPVYGGASCPNLTQTRTCDNPLRCPGGENEYRYSLKVGAWSQCRLPWAKSKQDFSFGPDGGNSVMGHSESAHHHHLHHHHSPKAWDVEIGYQTRQAHCTRSDGSSVPLSHCIQESAPVIFQSCVMPRDCETSDWSSWSLCSKTCRAADLSPGYRTRTRKLRRFPAGGGKECPVLEDREACNIVRDSLPLCPRFEWRTTGWGDCLIGPLLRQQEPRHPVSAPCGGGVQIREVFCALIPDENSPHHKYREAPRPVNRRLCNGPFPPAVQNCSIPCPGECLLSQWSAWGPCLHENCMEPQGSKGFKQRTRSVIELPGGISPSCPHAAEYIPCEDPACSQWRVVSEDLCAPYRGSCGPGLRNQTALCTNTQGEAVAADWCLEEPPGPTLPCEVPCPGDCVVSSWSPWSACSQSCSSRSSQGRQSRTRTVLALPGEGGKACPAATALEDWRSCNNHPCFIFYWDVSAWGSCIEDSSMPGLNTTATWNRESTCAVGFQTRQVACIKMNVGQVIPKRCPDSTRPDQIRPCSLPCKKDCIVTPFSDWTPCPSICLPANASTPSQSRYRIIIQQSTNRGQDCPDTLYEERECESVPVCLTYRWKTHKWHQCTLVSGSVQHGMTGAEELCGLGLETRGVSCVGEDEETTDVTDCLQWAGPMPQRVRPCRVPCADDCSFSAWSKFTECTDSGGTRSRNRVLTGHSKKREKCQNLEPYHTVESEACPSAEFTSQPYGNWSACILPESSDWRPQRERDMRECGPGVRYRAVACEDKEGCLVHPSLCGSLGYMEEACHIPCPLDCKLSDWSAWSGCSVPCGSGVKVRSKWLREKPFNGGRPCPKLDLKNQVYEAVPCYSDCSLYQWATEPWSVCSVNTVDTLPACGEGVQTRKIKCVKRSITGPAVDDGLCDQEDIPFRAQTCFLPCPEACVMSEWGQWSTCSLPCDQNTQRKRWRQTLRLSQSGEACPEESQTESCVLNSTCFTYHYSLSEWSSCLLSERAVCGRGSTRRLLDCVRSDGKVVDLVTCEELGLVKPWELTLACVVDCPINCLLSEWSAWTECSHTCGSQGQMTRSRSVTQQAREEGRPCPSQLSQTKPCPIRPCYRWLLGDWSVCRVEGADCGEGLRERNLTCVVHWGSSVALSPSKPVEEEKCEDQPRKASPHDLQRPCSVPCPGDCHLTEWSSWSSCQLTCLDGRSFETIGRQTRSRAVIVQVIENQENCPVQIFETQPCKGGQCHSYEWRTSGWRDNERSVWCQRSDGVNVSGGCFLQNRPTTVRHCYPPCAKPFSLCTQSGVCGCEKGYAEVMTSHGFLDYCTKTDVHNKADVKTTSGRFKPGTSQIQHFLSEWSLLPVGPDGRVKLWIYGVTVGGFLLVLLFVVLLFLMCKTPKECKSPSPPQKPLSLAYDGDVDM